MPDLMVQMNHLLEDNGRRRSAGTNRSGTRKLRTDITEKHGQLEFYTGERDGFVELCVQAYMATRATPRRIALRIQKHYTEEHERREAAAEKKAQADAVKVPDSMQTDMLVKVETSRITTELERLAVRARDCGTVSRTAQKRDEEFHLTSMKLHRAVRWYPIFRVAILIVAGYLQASHVVRYMKNRHIY